MECKVIQDLLPLYVDSCCSQESAKLVEEHIALCDTCKNLYENMKTPYEVKETPQAPKAMRRINDWKASLLQSLLLFFSFGLITVGVALEARTPIGLMNGWWAVSLVIPATGLLLSLANWYFVRLYKSRRGFSNCSALVTLLMTAVAYIWSAVHYEFNLSALFGAMEAASGILLLGCVGIVLSIAFCALSKVLSGAYAKMLGKD